MNWSIVEEVAPTAHLECPPTLRPEWGNHAVQFYETEEFLADVVAEFVATSLRSKDPVLVIATGPHRAGVKRKLEAKHVDLDEAIVGGHIELLDAEEMLNLVTVDGEPHWDAFMAHVGKAVRDIRARHDNRPLRAFGEIVDLLCKNGNAAGAAQLEDMWNELAKTESFTLLCAYELDNFRGVGQSSTFDTVCAGHSHVLMSENFRALDEPSRLREIGRLELRARTLETEMDRRKALHLALREREEALRDFIENGLDGIQWVSPDGAVLFTNTAQLQLLGYTRSEYLGRHVRDAHADDDAIEEILRRLARGETLRDFEVRLRCKDGSIKEVLVQANVYCRDGVPVHSRWFTRDVTDRKRAEEKLREQSRINVELLQLAQRAEGAAQVEREKLRRLFMQSPAHILILRGPDYTYDFVNATASTLLGRDVIGRTLHEVLPDFPPERRAILDRVLATGRRHTEDGVRSVMDWNRSGRSEERVFNMVYEPYLDASGTIEGVMSFGFDVTEQVNAQRKIERAAVELEIANRTKDEFLATLSHELRTPLNAILGWIRMLRSGVLSPEKTAQALETIERNATIQTQLVEDLLDVSRIIAGKLRMDVCSVELSLVIDNAIEAVRPIATAKGIALHTMLSSDVPILGDPDRLQQVIWNLLTNAVRFTPKGGTVEVSLRHGESSVDVAVSDSGQGIPSEFLPYVFERFRQADATTSRAHGGLGLGLAIARSIVELHGGTVAADSKGSGKGSTFTVRLPRSYMPSTGSTRPPAVRLGTAYEAPSRSELSGLHILIVDDERDARELVSEMLTVSSNATVSTCGSVAEALRMVRDHRPDVVISDIGMPGEDGYDLIRKLRALPPNEGGRTPAVALTAYARVEDRTKALIAGFNMHLPKPVEQVELLAVLSNLALMFPSKGEA